MAMRIGKEEHPGGHGHAEIGVLVPYRLATYCKSWLWHLASVRVPVPFREPILIFSTGQWQ